MTRQKKIQKNPQMHKKTRQWRVFLLQRKIRVMNKFRIQNRQISREIPELMSFFFIKSGILINCNKRLIGLVISFGVNKNDYLRRFFREEVKNDLC